MTQVRDSAVDVMLTRTQPAFPPAFMRPAVAAYYCGVSLRQWQKMDALRECPAAIEWAGVRGWRKTDLDSWIELQCPDREHYESMLRMRRMTA